MTPMIAADTASVSLKGVAEIAGHEDFVPAPYWDAAKPPVLTIFFGHTANAGAPDPRSFAMGVPADIDAALTQGLEVLRRDLERFTSRVQKALSGMQVTQPQFDAAVSFDFNTGAIHTATWVKTWRRGDLDRAADEMLNWRTPASIIPRRKAERRLWADGTYSGKAVTVWGTDGKGNIRWSKPVGTVPGAEIAVRVHGLDGAPQPSQAPAPMGRLLRAGATGDSVRALQLLLTEAGFSPGRPDGIFGFATHAAVQALQGSRGLRADGIVGPDTWTALLPRR